MPLVHTLPTIVTVHDVAWLRVQSHTPPYARAYFGALHVRAYRTAAAVVCDSQFSASEYSALVDPRATPEVVYPGVDPRFAQIARRPDLAEPFALVVGTVEARKNLLALIDVLPNVERLRLVSVGPHTPYADAVRRRARELGVGDRVVLRGYVGREELDELYARAICALVPSRYEGFGYALAEAQCAGLPAIAACTSSLVEVACPGTPLVDPDDVASWTDALRALLADAASAERNAAGARAVALQRYSWPAAATRLCSIYERVLSRQ
jgi:glycosyltransferase involved in cell wall biosynthesis